MIIVFYILLVCLGIYMLILGWLAAGFQKTALFRPAQKNSLPLSIIICARDEEKNIVRCLKSILDQDYDLRNVQLILINDASRDATVQLAERVLKGSGMSYRIISNQQQKGKKQSISYAMQFVTHELVVLRDADTFTRSRNWLRSVSGFYTTLSPDLIIAPVAITNNFGMLWAIQAIENNILVLMAAGSAYYKRPFLCNGANLIFTKTIFERVNGYTSHMQHLSGDDIFFLEDVKKIKDAKIAYLKAKDGIVYTYPSYSFIELVRQKSRWASKFKYNSNGLNFSLALITFLVNTGWLLAFAWVFAEPSGSRAALVFILLKLSFDILLLFLTSRFIKNRNLMGFSLPVACVYPVYASLVALSSVFIKPKWKV